MTDTTNARTARTIVSMREDHTVSKIVNDFYGEDRIITKAELLDTEFPTIEITTLSEDTYYLQPFRGYRFQVSGSQHGAGDYGSSDVVGLGNIQRLELDENETNESRSSIFSSNVGSSSYAMIKEFERLLIEQALRKWYVAVPNWEWHELINEFIKRTIRYISQIIQREIYKR